MKRDLPSLHDPLKVCPGYNILRSFRTENSTRHESVVHVVSADCALGVFCTFKLPDDWLPNPPTVWCHERWFRRGIVDWHTYSDGGLCWDLDLCWYYHLKPLREILSREKLARHATEYLLNSVRSLLVRHFIGYKLGLQNWPSEWAQWAHGKEGVAEYMRVFK